MEQRLCNRCLERVEPEYGKVYAGIHFTWLHCHHDEPDPEKKEKCWCEYPMVRRSQWIGLECPEETRHWHIDNCPACGKRLVT